MSDLEMARINVHACAYNAAVNYGTERGRRKMWDLIRALNDEARIEGKAKMDELVSLGIIDSYTPCLSECCIRPGGLFHVKDCPNDWNSEFHRALREKAYEQLPEPKRIRLTGMSLVGDPHDYRLDAIVPLVSSHRHTDPIGNPITCADAGCEG